MPRHLRSIISKVSAGAFESSLDLVFPAVCPLCDRGVDQNSDFCKRCATALTASQRMMESACPRCGRPGQTSSSDSHCHHCKANRFLFDEIFALWAYLDRVRDAIVAAKYAHHAPLGDALGRRLANRLKIVIAKDRPDTVTFVPSHFTRQFSRGGNGNQTIATAVATGIDRPIRQLLITTRRIAKQAWLEEGDRAKNVRGAFATKKSYAFLGARQIDDQRIANRHILVVDDVLTTGATASEVAGVLKEAGASRVTLAVVARAVS